MLTKQNSKLDDSMANNIVTTLKSNECTQICFDEDVVINKRDGQVLLPNDDSAIIYKNDGTTKVCHGPFDCKKLKEVIVCKYFQMIICSNGELKDKFELG